MPKTTRKKRWEHPTLRHAYCIERYGNVYTTICGENAQVIKGLKWCNENKHIAIRILGERYTDYMKFRSGESLSINKDILLSEAIDDFLNVYSDRLSNNNKSHYITALKNYLPVDMPIANLKEIRNMMLEQKKVLNHSANTQIKQFQKIKFFFNYCIEQDYIVKNPIIKHLIPDRTEKKILMFTREEVEQIIGYYNSERVMTYYLSGKQICRKKSSIEANTQYPLFLEFISYIGTRASETIKIFFDESKAPFIIGDTDKRKSVIKDNLIVIDGKRTSEDTPSIREFPLDLVPKSYEIIEKCRKYETDNNGKLFKYQSFTHIEKSLRNVIEKLNLEGSRSLHSLRKTAINHWENDLGINPYICAYMAGHSEVVRRKFYRVKPGAEELIKMHNKFLSKENSK